MQALASPSLSLDLPHTLCDLKEVGLPVPQLPGQLIQEYVGRYRLDIVHASIGLTLAESSTTAPLWDPT